MSGNTFAFVTPTDNRYFDPPLERWHWQKGRSVWRLNGVWYEQPSPFWGSDASRSFYQGVETDTPAVLGIRDADLVPVSDYPGGEDTDSTGRSRYAFFGGHVYAVSDAVADVLEVAGYSSNLSLLALLPGLNLFPGSDLFPEHL